MLGGGCRCPKIRGVVVADEGVAWEEEVGDPWEGRVWSCEVLPESELVTGRSAALLMPEIQKHTRTAGQE